MGLALTQHRKRIPGRQTVRLGDQLQHRAPQLSEAPASSDSWFYFRSPLRKKIGVTRGRGKVDVGWLFLVSSIEVPNMPLTLCHGSLMGADVPHCELGNRHILHLCSREHEDIWHLKSLLVSMVNIMAFHDSARTVEIDFTRTAS